MAGVRIYFAPLFIALASAVMADSDKVYGIPAALNVDPIAAPRLAADFVCVSLRLREVGGASDISPSGTTGYYMGGPTTLRTAAAVSDRVVTAALFPAHLSVIGWG